METMSMPVKQFSAAKRGPKLLVVDDDIHYRDMVVQVLRSRGLEVFQVGDGCAALETYAREHRKGWGFDLVLLDLGLPCMNGSECLRKLKEIDCAAKIIITSGYDPTQELSLDLQSQAAGFLQKPFSLRDLLANVCNLLGAPAEA